MNIGFTREIRTREFTITVGGGSGGSGGLIINGGEGGKGIAINKDDAEAQMEKSMQRFYSMWSPL